MFSLIVVAAVLSVVVATCAGVIAIGRVYQRKARNAGYSSLGAYLLATPRSDVEKRDAVDLAVGGFVICLLGLLFPPLLLLGAFPLYFGARKIAHASMGLGLFEDADPPVV